MNEIRRERTEPGCTAVLEALSHRRRRRTLAYLRRNGAAPLDEVAGVLASGPDGDGSAEMDEDPAAIRATLQHSHVPKLEAADLVTRIGDGVATGDHPVLEDSRLDDLLAIERDDWGAVLDCLSDPRRRTTLAVLAGSEEPVDRTALAHEVARREPETSSEDVERVLTELHHVQLPKLAEAGLVAFEDDRESVRYLGHPELGDLSQMPAEDVGRRRELPL